MPKKPTKPKAASTPAVETVAQRMAKADECIKAGKVREAADVLRAVVEQEPSNLQAQHWFNWALYNQILRSPDPALQAEQRKARDLVLSLTAGTKAGGELTLPQRARAAALHYRGLERLRSVKNRDELRAALEDGQEAARLRDLPEHHLVETLATPLGWMLDAREGAPEAAYGKLVARVRDFPGPRSRFKPLQPHPDFAGFTLALDDEGYLDWLASQPKEDRPKDPKRAEELDEAFLLAAGHENYAGTNMFSGDCETDGRLGRLATLLHLGADLHAKAYDGKTAVHFAAAVGDARALRALAKAGARMDAHDRDAESALFSACKTNRAAAVKTLLESGLDPQAPNKYGRTALFEASQVEAAAALIDGGADVRFATKDGITVLHVRAATGNVPLVRLLLEKGADPSAKDKSGATPLDAALRGKYADVAALLGGGKKKGAVDVDVLLQALRANPKKILSLDFFEDKNTKRVESLLTSTSMKGPDSWDELAGACAKEHPGVVSAIVDLAARVLKPDPKTQSFSKAPRFVLGDLTIKGDLDLQGPLLVTGNLTVEGTLHDAGPDSVLGVGGNVTARALDTDGDVVIGGDLKVTELIYGYYNDNSLLVSGDATAVALIEDDHDVRIMGKTKVKHHFPLDEFDRSDPKLKKIFVADAFDKEGLSREKLFKRLAAGKPLFVKGG